MAVKPAVLATVVVAGTKSVSVTVTDWSRYVIVVSISYWMKHHVQHRFIFYHIGSLKRTYRRSLRHGGRAYWTCSRNGTSGHKNSSLLRDCAGGSRCGCHRSSSIDGPAGCKGTS